MSGTLPHGANGCGAPHGVSGFVLALAPALVEVQCVRLAWHLDMSGCNVAPHDVAGGVL